MPASAPHTVAVIGDGALTGGMAWEALNNIAADTDLPLVIVVNDNERSLSDPGGLRTTSRRFDHPRGTRACSTLGHTLNRTPVVGGVVLRALLTASRRHQGHRRTAGTL